jgi:Uma2 family endonuclease
MATSVLVPVSEYLRSSYEPDCDYVDGEVQERNLGETDHSDMQGQLLELLRSPANKVHLRANPEIRVQTGPTRFRVPDVCIRRVPTVREQVIRQPPLLCIEVLSPEDRMSRMRERVRDFLGMGVLEVWVFDPQDRSVMVFAGDTMVEHRAGKLTVPDTPAVLELADVFRVLDEY